MHPYTSPCVFLTTYTAPRTCFTAGLDVIDCRSWDLNDIHCSQEFGWSADEAVIEYEQRPTKVWRTGMEQFGVFTRLMRRWHSVWNFDARVHCCSKHRNFILVSSAAFHLRQYNFGQATISKFALALWSAIFHSPAILQPYILSCGS